MCAAGLGPRCLPKQQLAEPQGIKKTDGFVLKKQKAADIFHLPWEVLPTHSLYSYIRALSRLQMTLDPMQPSSLRALRSMFEPFWMVLNVSLLREGLTSGKASIIPSNTETYQTQHNHFREKSRDPQMPNTSQNDSKINGKASSHTCYRQHYHSGEG